MKSTHTEPKHQNHKTEKMEMTSVPLGGRSGKRGVLGLGYCRPSTEKKVLPFATAWRKSPGLFVK